LGPIAFCGISKKGPSLSPRPEGCQTLRGTHVIPEKDVRLQAKPVRIIEDDVENCNVNTVC